MEVEVDHFIMHPRMTDHNLGTFLVYHPLDILVVRVRFQMDSQELKSSFHGSREL